MAATLSSSSFFFFVLSFLSSHITLAPATAVDPDSTSCHPSDLAALRSIAAAFPAPLFNYHDQHSRGGGGGTSFMICCGRWSKWVTVTCSGGRVTGLHVVVPEEDAEEVIPRSTPFPSALCAGLPALTSLVITGARLAVFTGGPSYRRSRPFQLCITGHNLTKLEHLDLSGNDLTGPISADSFPRSLQHLDLSSNQLAGAIPHTLSPLQSLRYLSLSSNSLSGSLPSFLANASVFPHLETLDLSSNAFDGPLPTFNTPALQHLDLSSNFLISESLSPLFQYSNLTSSQTLRLSENSLSGLIHDFHPSRFPILSELDLSFNFLIGALPNSICKLSQLYRLDLSGNQFSGHFSMPQCNSTQLVEIDISDNVFTGPFPDWLGSHRNLRNLSVGYNNFSGSVPESWRNLTSLNSLSLSGNSIIPPDDNPHEPKLPKWLFNISVLHLSSMQLQNKDLAPCCDDNGLALQVLDLSKNHITGVDHLSCFSYHNRTDHAALSTLNLSGNPLKLDLTDPNVVKLLPLQMPKGTLDLSLCMLVGSLTSLFFDRLTPSFSRLYLSHNQLEGQIPQGLGNMSSLRTLDLSYNSFTGFAPLMGGGFLELDLSLSNNDLLGDLSSMLSNMTANISSCDGCMHGLDLSHNHLTGAIPPSLGECLSISTWRLKLNHNHLVSFIPNELFIAKGASQLQILSLSNNHLSGPIPASFSGLTRLVFLDLSHNRLEGILETTGLFEDASSVRYTHLRVLFLGYNKFTGNIPTSLGVIAPALDIIDLSNNKLIGSITSQFLESLIQNSNIVEHFQGHLNSKGTRYEEIVITVKGETRKLTYVIDILLALDLSQNKLSGEISDIGLGKLPGLVYLNLSGNSFSGPLPSDLGNLGSQLESLDLSFNEFQGPIPQSYQNLINMAVFNVSYNEGLQGPIPQNSPQFGDERSYIGDLGLCGQPVHRACNIPNFARPQKIISNTTLGWFDEWISIPGLCLGFVIGFPGFLWFFKAFRLYL